MSAATDANSIYGQIGNLSWNDILQYGAVRAVDNNLGGTTSPTTPNAPQTTAAQNGSGGSTTKIAPNPSGLNTASIKQFFTDHKSWFVYGGLAVGGLWAFKQVLK